MTLVSSLAQDPISRSLDEIQKSEAKLRQVVDTIPALVWSNLADGPNDFSNQRWQDYTGISSEDARGWGWQAAVHPEDLPKLMETWQEMGRQGRRASSSAASPPRRGVPLVSLQDRSTRRRVGKAPEGSEQLQTSMP